MNATMGNEAALARRSRARTWGGMALLAAIVIALSALWPSNAYAALATGTPAVSGNTITCTQTQAGSQIYPVNLKAGAVKLQLQGGAANYTSGGIYPKLDSNGDVSGAAVAIASVSVANGSSTRYDSVPQSGTYYVQIYGSSTGAKLTITQYPYAATKTAKLNASTLGTGLGDYNKVVYYKVAVKKRGYLAVNVSDMTGYAFNGYVKLLNSKKKSLVGSGFDISSAKKTAYYGVKKGTYYIAVKSYADLYQVKPKFTAKTKAVKTKKSKAVLIKKGKAMGAVMAAGEKTAWYKFKVTKNKRYTITVKGKLHDGVKFVFSGKGYYSGTGYLYSGSSSNKYRTNKLKPGTYYVQVKPVGKGNGFYSITWK